MMRRGNRAKNGSIPREMRSLNEEGGKQMIEDTKSNKHWMIEFNNCI